MRNCTKMSKLPTLFITVQVKCAFGVGHRKTQLYQKHCAKLNMRVKFCFVHCIVKNDVLIHFSEQKLFFIRYLWIFANRFVKEFEGCLTNYFSACDSKVRMAFVNWQQWKGWFIPAFCESLVAKKKKKDLGDFWQILCYVIFFSDQQYWLFYFSENYLLFYDIFLFQSLKTWLTHHQR